MPLILLRRVTAYLLDVVVLFGVLAPLGFAMQAMLGVEVGARDRRSVPRGERLYVYKRGGEPCRHCGAAIDCPAHVAFPPVIFVRSRPSSST